MEINYTLVAVAIVMQFILGAVWHSPLMFGKIWMEIMGADKYSPEEIAKIQKETLPFYFLQLILTTVTTISFAGTHAMGVKADPSCNIYAMAFGVWFGFIAPIQISSVIWGKTEKKYWVKQLAIMLSMPLVGLMLAAFILSM